KTGATHTLPCLAPPFAGLSSSSVTSSAVPTKDVSLRSMTMLRPESAGQAVVDFRFQIAQRNEVASLHFLPGFAAQFADSKRMALSGIQKDLLGTCAIRCIGNRDTHFLPNIREVAGVVVDRVDEDLGIAHNHDAARVLATANPG